MKLVEMINKYIHEVTHRLAPKMQDDVALELRSTIEDMLPADYTEEDVKEVLTKFGDPSKLARQYREVPSYLFGQHVYDFFIFSLKAAGFVFLVIALIMSVTGIMVLYTGESSLWTIVTSISGDLIGAL